jgi:small subunit ribosomal protein S16
MLRIRLRRVGKKKQPMYRIVVADSRSPRDGDFVESIGTYHPMDNPSSIVLDEERAKLWLGRGAQPSDRVAKILAIQGVAEIPAKLATRIALGEQRAKDAAAAAIEEQAKTEAPVAAKAAAPAATPAAAAEAAEAPAAEEPPPEAQAEEPGEG